MIIFVDYPPCTEQQHLNNNVHRLQKMIIQLFMPSLILLKADHNVIQQKYCNKTGIAHSTVCAVVLIATSYLRRIYGTNEVLIIIQDKVQESGNLLWPTCSSSVMTRDTSKYPKHYFRHKHYYCNPNPTHPPELSLVLLIVRCT